jgi:hypothetical protein
MFAFDINDLPTLIRSKPTLRSQTLNKKHFLEQICILEGRCSVNGTLTESTDLRIEAYMPTVRQLEDG